MSLTPSSATAPAHNSCGVLVRFIQSMPVRETQHLPHRVDAIACGEKRGHIPSSTPPSPDAAVLRFRPRRRRAGPS